jgi:Na+/H+ antiporter NhaD/arsenite permease-like protein
MSSLTIAIVVVFVVGYLFIALESITKVNKAAVALLMFVACWTLFMVNPGNYISGFTGNGLINEACNAIERHLGSTSTTLFFLMGAMTIVEIVDQNGGFNWVQSRMFTKSKRELLWKIAFMTFFLSAILDNLTTSIVMIMILRKLVHEHKDRIIYASLVIIAANAGGAFSPIGDVTTIMLWNKGVITALGIISEMFVPAVVSLVIPALILQTQLKGELKTTKPFIMKIVKKTYWNSPAIERKVIFFIGVGGLMFVPVFKSLTNLPPFVGILFVLGILWTTTELFYRRLHKVNSKVTFQKRVSNYCLA